MKLSRVADIENKNRIANQNIADAFSASANVQFKKSTEVKVQNINSSNAHNEPLPTKFNIKGHVSDVMKLAYPHLEAIEDENGMVEIEILISNAKLIPPYSDRNLHQYTKEIADCNYTIKISGTNKHTGVNEAYTFSEGDFCMPDPAGMRYYTIPIREAAELTELQGIFLPLKNSWCILDAKKRPLSCEIGQNGMPILVSRSVNLDHSNQDPENYGANKFKILKTDVINSPPSFPDVDNNGTHERVDVVSGELRIREWMHRDYIVTEPETTLLGDRFMGKYSIETITYYPSTSR